MPLQLYDRDKILDDCLSVFAQHGYDNTSTAMLADAAGISKALIFHHFNSKKELYLCLLERCVAQARSEIKAESLLQYDDFFEARERLSIMKYTFNKNNPNIYKVLVEAYVTTPEELKPEIETWLGGFFTERNSFWEEMFAKVPLREGVDRAQAFELVVLALDHFDQKFMAKKSAETELDDQFVQSFLGERRSFLALIRHGIEQQ